MTNIKITIKQIEEKEGEYLAYHKNEFLNATYSVHFTDSLQGSISLVDFTRMLKYKYETDQVEFEISNEKINLTNSQLLATAIFDKERLR